MYVFFLNIAFTLIMFYMWWKNVTHFYSYIYLISMSKTRSTHNMGLSQCCVVFAFLKHHLAQILEFKHNTFLVLFIQFFWKIKVLIKPQFVVPCDGFGFFANFIFNCFFVRNYALSLCKTFDYVRIRFNAKLFTLRKWHD
jgi:hypothetical protein